jgi:c-di-GMP phosphodiesterase
MDRSLATRYVARQPIVDTQRELAGFELLFRDSTENRASVRDDEIASKNTVDAAVLLGLETLSAGYRVFLNCSENFLIDGFPTLFPPELTMVEVLETVRPTSAVVRACRELKRLGYGIALDDFVAQPGYDALVEVADLIKVDVQATSPKECVSISQKYLPMGRQLLAEKVETEEEFQTTAKLGFSLFQGYLLSKPSVLAAVSLDGLEINRDRVLRLLAKPHLDLVETANIIKSDPALCYRLLKFLKSPAFYLQSEIRSILQAVTLLGAAEMRKWLLLVCSVGEVKPRQRAALTAALVRGRFVELIAAEAHLPASEPFLIGLLSAFDSVLGVPLATIVAQIAISDEICAALLDTRSPLHRCLELARAYEKADWATCEIKEHGLVPTHILGRTYREATRWAAELSHE